MTIDELETRLDTLGQSLPPRDPAFAARVLREASQPPPQVANFWSRWTFATLLGTAAMLCIASAFWLGLFGSPKPAWAIEELPQRLRALQSLHMKGNLYLPDGSPAPIEYFVQKPNLVRIRGATSIENGVPTQTRDLCITPTQLISIDQQHCSASIEPNTPERAEAAASAILSQMSDLLLGVGSTYQKLRSETVGPRAVDVYEGHTDTSSRTLLWLDSATGLPVRSEDYLLQKGEPDRLLMRIDTIEANGSLPNDLFQSEIPSGFRVTQAVKTPDEKAFDSLTFGSFHIVERFAAQVNNDTLLVCWALFDERKPADDLKIADAASVTIQTVAGTPLVEHMLRADPSPAGYHWRWSLLKLATPQTAANLRFRVKVPGEGGGDMSVVALRADRAELERRIAIVQQATLPPGGKPMTLEQIEAAAK